MNWNCEPNFHGVKQQPGTDIADNTFSKHHLDFTIVQKYKYKYTNTNSQNIFFIFLLSLNICQLQLNSVCLHRKPILLTYLLGLEKMVGNYVNMLLGLLCVLNVLGVLEKGSGEYLGDQRFLETI